MHTKNYEKYALLAYDLRSSMACYFHVSKVCYNCCFSSILTVVMIFFNRHEKEIHCPGDELQSGSKRYKG